MTSFHYFHLKFLKLRTVLGYGSSHNTYKSNVVPLSIASFSDTFISLGPSVNSL